MLNINIQNKNVPIAKLCFTLGYSKNLNCFPLFSFFFLPGWSSQGRDCKAEPGEKTSLKLPQHVSKKAFVFKKY